MNEQRRYGPPEPKVQYLPQLFRKIQQGEIRIPAFQRGFVWMEAQVLDLLNSVYSGFPIGSLLFWRVEEPILRVERADLSTFPDLPEKYPINFVLDGLQRLTTLYGVFHRVDVSKEEPFNVVFDLQNAQFLHYSKNSEKPTNIRLSSLFQPKDFLDAQRSISLLGDADILLDRAINLHATFQEYMVPTVTIADRAVPEVVSIFERINSTGTRLSAVDFMRAVTWSQEFDLNREMAGLEAQMADVNFDIPTETLVKGLAVVLGKAPTAESMLELRGVGPQELTRAVQTEFRGLIQVIAFLHTRFNVFTYEYIPYEGQLLVLLRFFQLVKNPGANLLEPLAKWFWSVSLNEELRGKPDHVVGRLINRVEELAGGVLNALTPRLDLNTSDLMSRRFIRGKALSSAFAAMFATRPTRSLLSGTDIPPSVYMVDFSPENFRGLYSLQDVRKHSHGATSNKILANVVVALPFEAAMLDALSPPQILQDLKLNYPDFEEILESQFIDKEATKAIERGDMDGFLKCRAETILTYARKLVGV